ncbi:FAD-dependent 5-carboxymethylaminomethyl-2-thiouridine(34) oxidoreductase MnmC [Neisseria wadsworthii]|uniref:FAD-dependent 5-carboxymethylaminomethyl-2-thiouridine(34) oxidoreductase MnmC n=1 Tax=Neisseria wadsworthii TaxID=607711 RepID=UPI000D3188BA
MPAAFNYFPALATLLKTAESYRHIVICLPDLVRPERCLSEESEPAERELATLLRKELSCLQFSGPNVLHNVLPNAYLWLMPPASSAHLYEYFSEPVQWQTEAVAQAPEKPQKPWFIPPASSKPKHVVVVGAGIAGAATARALAEHGVRVSVLEAEKPAQAASGNRQGLLYAKISPHNTEQTELLLCGYGHTRRLLEHLLPQQGSWGGNGVLHLNHNTAETQRNALLGQQTHHTHLYRNIDSEEASSLAGVALTQGGLFWPQGIWLNPPAFVNALLTHPNITLHTHAPLQKARHAGKHWQLTTQQTAIEADCMVYCTGASSGQIRPLNHLPLRFIRGQTALAPTTSLSENLLVALSGASYIAPAWQGIHCYGATFIQHDNSNEWREEEEQANQEMLHELHSELARNLLSDRHSLQGHAAVRCDSSDHLPLVGALGDSEAMRKVYAKLALDRNYRISTPCPYLPNVYVNTAHGTRGLASAPICAESLAAEILGLPNPLSRRIREALHPNRFIVRAIVRGGSQK